MLWESWNVKMEELKETSQAWIHVSASWHCQSVILLPNSHVLLCCCRTFARSPFFWLEITYVTAWAFAFGHSWNWQSNWLVGCLSGAVQYSDFPTCSQTSVFKKPEKLFQAWQRTKESRSMKRKKTKQTIHAWIVRWKKQIEYGEVIM